MEVKFCSVGIHKDNSILHLTCLFHGITIGYYWVLHYHANYDGPLQCMHAGAPGVKVRESVALAPLANTHGAEQHPTTSTSSTCKPEEPATKKTNVAS